MALFEISVNEANIVPEQRPEIKYAPVVKEKDEENIDWDFILATLSRISPLLRQAKEVIESDGDNPARSVDWEKRLLHPPKVKSS
jgi:hypothetical protein